MNQLWKGISGWGNFESVHREVFAQLPDGATVVELGVAHGRGLAAMVAVAEDMGKKLRIIGVDHFQGTAGEDVALYYGQMSAEKTAAGMASAGVLPGTYEILVNDTVAAASQFEQVDYVFLDADHSYEGVLKDLAAWYPKVATGGFIGGHDWEFSTVSSAVLTRFPNPKVIEKECWLHRKA